MSEEFQINELMVSILGPISFLIYINDLHLAIKYCEVYHFAYDTNLLTLNSCPKSINDKVKLNKFVKDKQNFLKC